MVSSTIDLNITVPTQNSTPNTVAPVSLMRSLSLGQLALQHKPKSEAAPNLRGSSMEAKHRDYFPIRRAVSQPFLARSQKGGQTPKPRPPTATALTMTNKEITCEAPIPENAPYDLSAFKAACTTADVSVDHLLALYKEAVETPDKRLALKHAKLILKHIASMDQHDGQVKHLASNTQHLVRRLANPHSRCGLAEAQYFLAKCHGLGLMGFDIDPEKAFQLYLQGSKQNHPECTYRVAVCYEIGSGTKPDEARAVSFYRKGARLGDPSAMYKLGMILLKGFMGQPVNSREGISWLKRAVRQGKEQYPLALHELGLAYEKQGHLVDPDVTHARDLFQRAAECGYAPSQFKLGQAYENGWLDCEVDPQQSVAWYTKAAEQGDPDAELALSGWYLTGAEGVLTQSDDQAYIWAERAASKGHVHANYAMGYYTESGIGVHQDFEKAKLWYQEAAAHHHPQACKRLKELQDIGSILPVPQTQRHKTEHSIFQKPACHIM